MSAAKDFHGGGDRRSTYRQWERYDVDAALSDLERQDKRDDREHERAVQAESAATRAKGQHIMAEMQRAQTEAQLTDSSGRSVTGRAAVDNLEKTPAIVVICWNPERGIRMKDEYKTNPDGSLTATREIPGGRAASYCLR